VGVGGRVPVRGLCVLRLATTLATSGSGGALLIAVPRHVRPGQAGGGGEDRTPGAQIKRAPRRVADNGHIGREQASLGLQNGPIGSWRTVSDPVFALKVALTRSRATVGAPLHRASNPWSLRDRPTDSSTDSHRVIAELSARVAAFCAGPGGRQAQLALAGNDHEVVSLMPITCHILAC
jgi:hypothetical protein